jgi:hypothetical protein
MVKIPFIHRDVPEFVFVVLGTLIGAIIGGYFTYHATYDVYKEQQYNNKQTIAQALYIDITLTSFYLNASSESYSRTVNHFSTVNNNTTVIFYTPLPFYTDTGYYYTHSADISTLNSSLASEILEYYYNVMIIESERQYIDTHFTKTYNMSNLSQSEQDNINGYTNVIPKQINIVVTAGDKIKTDLKNDYNLKTNISQYFEDVSYQY